MNVMLTLVDCSSHYSSYLLFLFLVSLVNIEGNADVSRQEKWHKRPFVVLDELSAALKALVMALLRFHDDNTV